MKVLKYLSARLEERTTWVAIAGGIPTAALLPYPWNIGSLGVAIVLGLIPTGGGSGQ